MSKYLKYFNEDAEYQQFKDSSEYIEPNVSYVENRNVVYYHPFVVETRVVCTYNVTDITNATQLCKYVTGFTSMEIDDVMIDNVTTGYTFNSVGEHTVKFELAEPIIIGNAAFQYCYDLTSVVIPDSVTTIGDYAFEGCYDLTSVEIGSGVTSIGDSAFADCTRLTGELVIPDSVTSIGNNAFNHCDLLKGELVIPDSVTYIGERAFYSCRRLKSVVIGSGVTSIGNAAFQYCYGLTSVVIPDSVTSIGGSVFGNCGYLASVEIGSGVTSIGKNAFSYCEYLTEITSNAVIAPTISNYTFQYIKTGGVLKVPVGSDYSTWMSTSNYYLGKYNWTIEYI